MIMPVLNGELTGNQRGAGSMSLFDDLKQIPTFGIRQRGQSQVIEDQKMGFRKSFHQGLVAAIGSGQADLIEELRGSEVEGMKPFPAGLLGKGTGKEGLADSRWATDEQVLVISDPGAGGEAQDHGFFHSSWGFVVDVLDAGLKFEFGVLEEAFEPFVLFPCPLTIDQHPEALLEGEVMEGGLLQMFFKSLSHSDELHGVKFIEGLFIKHGLFPSFFHW